MRLTTKYPLIIVTLSLAAALVTGLVGYQISEKQLRAAAERQSLEILESRKASLSRYLRSIEQDLMLMAASRTIRDALTLFTDTWALIEDPGETLQKLYIYDNPYAAGEKQNLDDADDGSAYSAIHARYHPWIREFLEIRGYYDVFLFDTRGNLVYSVIKETDFATNFVDGRWRGTDLGQAYRTTAYNQFPEFRTFHDFKPYAPSGGASASFIATPVFDDEETYIGVMAIQMPNGRINEIMTLSSKMGEAGQAYLVGLDLQVRNTSPGAADTDAEPIKKPEVIVHRALEGISGTQEITGPGGERILATYTSLSFAGQTWAILAEFDLEDVLAPVTHMRRVMLLAGLVIAALVTLAGIWFAAGLSRPIVGMTGVMKRLAERDLEVEIPASGRADELGEMAATLAVFKENAIERVRAETSLRQNEALLRAALENMPGAMWVADGDLTLVLVNDQYKEFYGDPGGLVKPGGAIPDILRAEAEQGLLGTDETTIEDILAERLASFRADAVTTFEDRTADGRHIQVIRNPNRDGLIVSVATDISELKATEEALTQSMNKLTTEVFARKRAQEELHAANTALQELNELKNKFMGMAAHDLRNPLGAIRGMTHMIMELDLDRTKEKEFVASINDVSDQMLDLLNDLLDVSAIESGSFDLQREPGDLGAELKGRVDLIRYTAEAKNIAIAVDVGEVPAIPFDASRIHQVIDNLLSNAIKFSPAGTAVEATVRETDTALEVEIRDHGQGIPEDEVPKVFEAFEKLSTRPTAGEKSTGLGLAIVKRIIDAHEGRIWVESTLGEGTTFTFSLPKAPKA